MDPQVKRLIEMLKATRVEGAPRLWEIQSLQRERESFRFPRPGSPPEGRGQGEGARTTGQVRSSQRDWKRSSSWRVYSSIGCSRSGMSTVFGSPQRGVVK